MSPLDELAALLRPAGGGLFLVSTGRAAQLAMQRQLYGVADEAGVDAAFRRNLAAIADARVVILGCPSDVGAGFLRGANVGPQAIRSALLASDGDWTARAAAAGVVDIGDVFVIPQLLHDDMLSAAQLAASRRALYGHLPEETAATLPVAPLSIAERALDLVYQLNPRVVPVVLGGDHSNAWPVAANLARHRRDRWAIVQPDAHTDLLPERLGIKICFATWSYHANELLGRDGRLVQVGVRASRYDRGHWEQGLGVRQFWADEVKADPAGTIRAIVAHLKALDVGSVYFSNDIDGTDSIWADAAGTPEPDGLEPDFVVDLIRALGREIGLCAADVVEVAPPLARDGGKQTVELAVRYLRESLAAIAGPELAPGA
ncbi:arginase family protein [Nannocystis sp. SCPEA4]|uniref:arginase family protein n=1 Tax=Nannocystis sp. SCPEA4 TaxID=2996787 RepID=UPI002271DE4E|nr:arginase family protein [Nannocystis sp. SCPEA4]MCY1063098.1 arginase family protein [Nannocystis sp. SCPEA4]